MSGSGRAHDRRRRRQRAVWWERWREYANGTLWVMPGIAALLALLTGFAMAQVRVRPGSVLSHVAFQGTADDARSLLIEVTGTVVTVIALTLGLTVVALQLSSTQFSPRLLRNFLRDRGTQVVLSVFIATFVYAAAGSFTVGVESGARGGGSEVLSGAKRFKALRVFRSTCRVMASIWIECARWSA